MVCEGSIAVMNHGVLSHTVSVICDLNTASLFIDYCVWIWSCDVLYCGVGCVVTYHVCVRLYTMSLVYGTMCSFSIELVMLGIRWTERECHEMYGLIVTYSLDRRRLIS
jgi:hypothetical protein